jgi:hypothetical protein
MGAFSGHNDPLYFVCPGFLVAVGETSYGSVSQTVVRGPQVVLRFCPCGPLRLNISPKKTEKIKLTSIAYHTLWLRISNRVWKLHTTSVFHFLSQD